MWPPATASWRSAAIVGRHTPLVGYGLGVKRIVVAAGLVLALGASTAQAADVRVKPHNKDSQALDLSDYPNRADVHNKTYVVRNNQGPHEVFVEQGFSIQKILQLGRAGTVEGHVRIEGDGVVLLDRPNLRADAYDDGPPVFYEDEDGQIVFLRPERDGDPNNAKDVFSSTEGPIVITEYDERLLTLKIDASDTEIDPGDSVDFTATLQQDSGSSLESDITWNATGLEGQTGRAAMYEFPDEGNYSVSATVTDENDNVGEDTVEIQVGDPVESDLNQDGGGLNNNYYAPDTGSYYGGQGAATPDYSTDIPDTGADQSAAKPPPQIEAGEEVTGELLSETGVYVPPPPEELVGVRTGTPDEGTNWTTPGIALGATLVVGLLGFGAGREFERVNVDRLRRLLPG